MRDEDILREINSLSPEARLQVEDFIFFLRWRYNSPRPDDSPRPKTEIKIDIETPGLTISECMVPGDYTPERVISDVLEEVNLPRMSDTGEVISYSLLHVNRNLMLPDNKTLVESGVQNGDTVQFVPSRPNVRVDLDPGDVGLVGGDYSQNGEIEVVMTLLDLNKSERVTLPREATVGDIIRSVALDYGLPSRDKLNEVINYKLESKVLARFLGNAETLAQVGIPRLDRLTLHREEAAGGTGLPFVPGQPSTQAGERRNLALMRGAAARLKRIFSEIRYDPVDCTVYAPPTVPRGGACLIQVFAYRPEHRQAVHVMAKEIDEDATRRGFKSLEMKIARGSKLTFHLTLPDMEIEDSVQSITWHGHIESVQFGVTIPKRQRLGDIIGTVRISYEQIPLGHIKFKLTVVKAGRTASEPEPTGLGHAYKKAFISYATKDRREVLKRVQMLPKLRIKAFQDVLSLAPGARWKKELYRHIDECDLFLLFWSSAALRSEWVLEEVRYALKIKGDDDLAPPEIIPVPIEGPPPVQPPEELAHLHFNDYYLYFMAGT